MSRPGGNAGLLSDRQVDIIATRLAERVSGTSSSKPSPKPATRPAATAPRPTPISVHREALGDGVFATVDDAVDAAATAFREFDGMSLEGRRRIIAVRPTTKASSLPRSVRIFSCLGGLKPVIAAGRKTIVTR